MVPSILKGGEPFFFPGHEPGCLILHGFTASPQEVRGLGVHLASEGFTVLGVRLFGHGTKREDMVRSRSLDWHASAEDGYHLLSNICKTIIPIGLSLGGALAMSIAHGFPVAGFVSMSTPIRIPQSPNYRKLRPFLKPLSIFYPYYPKGPSAWYDPTAQAERVAYDSRPLRSILELETCLEEMQTLLPKI